MPYVEGETLRDRISREKQLPVDDAVRITVEVASALDYAHRHGVIHRDIKPENILLHDGSALVADFGIALAVSTRRRRRMTETGMSLGTPHYMSPEQAMGQREITATSDVYALGCVLYEMLVGEPPFTGPTAQAIIARVVTEEPRSLTIQRKTIPPQVEGAVRQALQKLPADRFKTAAEFADALQGRGNIASFAGTAVHGASAGGASAGGGWRARIRDPLVLVPALIAVAAVAVAVSLARRVTPPAVPPIRFVLAASDSTQPVPTYPWPAAISPDGGTVVYTVAQDANTVALYALRTDQLEPRPIPGTTDAFEPHFSPDGKWLAFGQDGKERKVRLDGSAPVTIATAGAANGAAWTTSDQIVMGSYGATHGLSHVSAAGGEPVALTEPDTANGKTDHIWPIALPDGKSVVFVIWSGSLSTSELAITFLDDGKVTPLRIQGIRPLAVLDGMLVYLQADGTVMAVKLDARGRKLAGRPIPVHDPVSVASANNGNSGVFISPGRRAGHLPRWRAWIARLGVSRRADRATAEAAGGLPAATPVAGRTADGRRRVRRAAERRVDLRPHPVHLFEADDVRDGDLRQLECGRTPHPLHRVGRRGAWRRLVAARRRCGSPAERLTQNIFLTPRRSHLSR